MIPIPSLMLGAGVDGGKSSIAFQHLFAQFPNVLLLQFPRFLPYNCGIILPKYTFKSGEPFVLEQLKTACTDLEAFKAEAARW